MIESIIPLLSLIALEVILGIDNIIFISILADKLPENQKNKLRFWGIGLAMVMRLCLLALISWILKLDKTLFTITDVDFSGKGLILIFGGLFLIYKSTKEIYHKTEAFDSPESQLPKKGSFGKLLGEVIVLDLVFSSNLTVFLFVFLGFTSSSDSSDSDDSVVESSFFFLRTLLTALFNLFSF